MMTLRWPTSTTLATTGKVLDTATQILDTVSKAFPGKDGGCRVEDFTRHDGEFGHRVEDSGHLSYKT